MKETNKQEKGIRVFLIPVLLISLLTAFDQFTKYVVTSNFKLYESKPVIDGVFAFTYVQNKGMAWGMFQNMIPVFLLFTAIILIFTFRIMYNVIDNKRYRWVKYVLIVLISGALGNMIDRITRGYVVDFFNFELIDFPVFNVADIYVVVSMISAMILLMFVYSNKELDEILKMSFKSEDEEIEISNLEVIETEIVDSDLEVEEKQEEDLEEVLDEDSEE